MGNQLYTPRRAKHLRAQERRMPRRHQHVSLRNLSSQERGVFTFGIARPVCNFAETSAYRLRKEVGEEHVAGEYQYLWPSPTAVVNGSFLHVLLCGISHRVSTDFFERS